MINLDSILPSVTKPARYTGGEWNSIVNDWETIDVKLALAYPDLYEIGMSNLGLSILYHLANREPYALAERVFAPWVDMEGEMRRSSIPLFSLESRRPIRDFDIVGFSLGYELTYTNVLNMLDLAGIPLQSCDRDERFPLVIAGGSCSLNPEPMAEFIDLFVLGDGEDVLVELLQSVREWKASGPDDRQGLLCHLSNIPGVYVPGLYTVEYHDDNTVSKIIPRSDQVPSSIIRRFIGELPMAITKPIVPFVATVHDRAMIEIQRGCTRGCRFCQAGIIYRPLRERNREDILQAAHELLKNTGHNELSLLSLSTSDYSEIELLISALTADYKDDHLKISLPSLRLDSFSVQLMDVITKGKKTGLTFAPEAGNERLRRVINKNMPDDTLIHTLTTAQERGWNSVKLYFMIGLPTETEEDIESIVSLLRQKTADVRKQNRKPLNMKISASAFVPKSHTPFQWVGQFTEDDLNARVDVLRQGLKKFGMRFSWQDPRISF
ncbi:MAG: TIGR03960 family B12-binding radical SAM protein, partial [Chloroflexota bacterium]|nr:TIGR03960 family B12-binding radical SAM protein [Chloroflexota bacterium]